MTCCIITNGPVLLIEFLIHKPVKNQLEASADLKVHLTPKTFFAKAIKLILWSNVPQKFFDLVKSLIFYGSSKYVKMPPFWFTTEFNGEWVEGRM